MDFLNKVHLRGAVGTVRETTIEYSTTYRFGLETEYCHIDKSGAPVIEVTWFSVVFYSYPGKYFIAKGSVVEVEGRLRAVKYTDANGAERMTYEVVASSVQPAEGVE